MLASITPLGERGRQARWAITMAAFVIGSVAAGCGAGALAGTMGAVVLPSSFGTRQRLAILALVALVALAVDGGPFAVPGPRRQVNERWLDEYRGWVYGVGFGAQLGLGVSTVVSSAATYLMLIAALLTGSVSGGVLIAGCFGAVRGLTLLAGAHVRTPGQLLVLHARLRRWRAPAERLGLVTLTAILALAVAGSLG